uniref:Selenoprotein M n=1 Tax=Neogobius melanostomus TaxID=47308 RepID=A0A8C6S848_9GOBI
REVRHKHLRLFKYHVSSFAELSLSLRSRPLWSRTFLCSILPHRGRHAANCCALRGRDHCSHCHNLVMKHIPGADPELVLLNHYFEELDRIPLTDMTRSEINELLDKLGFYKKEQAEDEVPDEFRFSPAKDSPFPDEPPFRSTAAPEPEKPEHTDL